MARYIEETRKFLKEVRTEMLKVTWPTWPELKGSTVLVIIVSVFFAAFIAVIDLILTNFIKLF
jgi:preprotein translocase subunit SecE